MTLPGKHLWTAFYGFLATPLLSLIALQTKFTMVSWACGAGQHWTIHTVTAIFVLLTASGGLFAYRSWRAIGSVRDLAGESSEQWIGFMLVVAIFMSILSTLLLLAMWLPDLLMGVCD
jgi:hypothetical protein